MSTSHLPPPPTAEIGAPARHGLAIGLMVVSAILFGLMGFFARLAGGHAPWALIAAVRALVGATVTFAIARAGGASLAVVDRRSSWLRSIFGTGSMLCSFYALSSREISLGDASTLYYMSPVFIALLAPRFLGERLERRVVVALPLAMAGVVLILRPAFVFGSELPRSAASVAVVIVALIGSFIASFAWMMLRRLEHEPPLGVALHFSLLASVVCSVIAIPSLHACPGRSTLIAMALAGVAAGLAQIALTYAFGLAPAARLSGISYLTVVTSAVLGIVFLGEPVSKTSLAGMVLVVAGGLVVSLAGSLR